MNNPTTASPVTRTQEVTRSPEVSLALAWFNYDGTEQDKSHIAVLAKYIAQLEASQPKPLDRMQNFLDNPEVQKMYADHVASPPKPQQSDEGLLRFVSNGGAATHRHTSIILWDGRKCQIIPSLGDNDIARLNAALSQASAPVPTIGAVEVAERIRRYCQGFFDADKAAAIIQQYGDHCRAEAPAADGKLREALRPMSEKPAQYPVLIKSAITGQFLQWNSDPWPVEHYWPDFVGWWDYIAAASALAQPASGDGE